MSHKSNPNFRGDLIKDLSPKLEKGAEEGANIYREDISRGVRTGIQHHGQPAISSNAAADESLQEQHGDHIGAVDWRPTNDPLVKQFGALGVPGMSDEALDALENGSADGTVEGRFSLTMAAERSESHKRILEAIEKA